MNATIISRTPTSFTLQVEVPYNDSMLDFEETLQQRLNEAGVVGTIEGLKQFDTDGSPITIGPVKLTTKGPIEKDYQTPYGVATVARHVADEQRDPARRVLEAAGAQELRGHVFGNLGAAVGQAGAGHGHQPVNQHCHHHADEDAEDQHWPRQPPRPQAR